MTNPTIDFTLATAAAIPDTESPTAKLAHRDLSELSTLDTFLEDEGTLTETTAAAKAKVREALIEHAARALARNAGHGNGEKLVHMTFDPVMTINGFGVIPQREAVPIWRLFYNDARVVLEALRSSPTPAEGVDPHLQTR